MRERKREREKERKKERKKKRKKEILYVYALDGRNFPTRERDFITHHLPLNNFPSLI